VKGVSFLHITLSALEMSSIHPSNDSETEDEEREAKKGGKRAAPAHSCNQQQAVLVLMSINLVFMVVFGSTLAYIAISLQSSSVTQKFVDDLTPGQVNTVLEKVANADVLPVIFSNLPFILGNSQTNWPSLAGKFFVDELPALLEDGSESIDKLRSFVEEIWESTTDSTLDGFFTYVTRLMNLFGSLLRSSAAAMSPPAQVTADAEPALGKVSGVFGASLALLGLKPKNGGEGSGYFYPALEWAQTQAETRGLVEFFDACASTLRMLEESQTINLYRAKFPKDPFWDCDSQFSFSYSNFDSGIPEVCRRTDLLFGGSQTCQCDVRGDFPSAVALFLDIEEDIMLELIRNVRDFCISASIALQRK